MHVFDGRVVDIIHQLFDTSPPLEWQDVIAYRCLYNRKHWVTHGGIRHCGYVCLFGERKRGWYTWKITIVNDELIYE